MLQMPLQAMAVDSALGQSESTTSASTPSKEVSNPTSDWRYENERANWYDGTDVPCGKTNIVSTTSSSLPSDFPEPARTMLTNAANAPQTSANVLAAVYMNEHGTDDYRTIPTDINKLNTDVMSNKNAKGPFQILVEYWKTEWGDITKFEDSSKAAAQYWLKETAKVGPNPPLGVSNEEEFLKNNADPIVTQPVAEGTVAKAFQIYNPGDPNYIVVGLKRYRQIGQPNGNASPPAATTSSKTNSTAFKPSTLAAETPTSTTSTTGATNSGNGDKTPGKVLLFGDSMLAAFAGNPTIELFKTKGWNDVEVIAKSGRGLTGGPPQFQPDGLAEMTNNIEKIKTAKAIVIELGTNAYNRPTFAQDVDAAIKIVKDNNPGAAVYWVDFAANSPEPAGRNKAYEGQNKTLIEKSSSGFKVISWFKTVYPDGDPSAIKADLVDTKDLIENQEVYVHPTSPAGVDAYANLIVENVINGGGTSTTVTNSTNCPANSANGTGQCIDDARLPKINDSAKVGEAINKYIETSSPPDAPLRNLGDKFVSGAIRAGINPFLMVAISQIEQQFGSIAVVGPASNIPGVADGTRTDAHNTFGLTATPSQPHVDVANSSGLRHWYAWESYEVSLDGGGTIFDQPTYMKQGYIDKGITNVRDFMLKYAPPSENNTDQYINSIKTIIKKMVDLSGDGVSCGNGTGGNLKNATIIKSFEGATITPTTIIIHYTAGHAATPEAFVNAIKSNKNCGPQGCSVQVWISTEGKVYQLVDPLNTYTEHVNSFNKHSIGIEIDGLNEAEITNNSTQYQAVLETVKDLMQIFGIKNEQICAEPNSKGIFGHFEANTCMNGAPGRGHTDPGPGYMAKLRADLGTQ